MTPQHIVRAAIPGASDALCDYVLWERTPFPVGRITAHSIYRAASRVKRAHEHKRTLCDFCDNEVTGEAHLCHRCKTALSSNKD
jgi:hypothetical protein